MKILLFCVINSSAHDIESALYGVLFTSCLCQKPERARYERVRAFDTNNSWIKPRTKHFLCRKLYIQILSRFSCVADSLNRQYNDTHRYVTYIVINVQTKGLLAVETKDSFVLWLAKDMFVNSVAIERYRRFLTRTVAPQANQESSKVGTCIFAVRSSPYPDLVLASCQHVWAKPFRIICSFQSTSCFPYWLCSRDTSTASELACYYFDILRFSDFFDAILFEGQPRRKL